jgi:DegV family protein with EDD domain
MASACIVTDSSVQFTRQSFIGRDLVFQVPFRISYMQKEMDLANTAIAHLPARLDQTTDLVITPPRRDEIIALFDELGKEYRNILAVSMSSKLSPVHGSMLAAARAYKGKADISVLDSTAVVTGLGSVVQYAAGLLHRGTDLPQAEEHLRAYTHHLYAQVACPNLRYLSNLGLIETSQAMLGEALGITPVFVMEEGRLLPATKVKNTGLLLENYQEFIGEFDRIDQVVITSGGNHGMDAHILKEHVLVDYPGSYFADLPLSLVNASLFGPGAIWITVVDR